MAHQARSCDVRLYPYLCEAETGGFLDLWEVWSQPGQPTEVLSHLTKWNKLELGMGSRRHASSASSRTYLHIWVVFLSCFTESCDRKHSSHSLGHFIFQLQAQGRFRLTIWIFNQICQGRDSWASLDQVSSMYKPTLDMNELSFKWVGNCEGFCQVSVCVVTVCMRTHRRNYYHLLSQLILAPKAESSHCHGWSFPCIYCASHFPCWLDQTCGQYVIIIKIHEILNFLK